MRQFSYFLLPLIFAASSCDKAPEPGTSDKSRTPRTQSSSGESELQDVLEARNERRKLLKTATGLKTSEERNKEIVKAVTDAIQQDPEFAKEAIQQLVPGSEEKNQLIENLTTRIALEDIKDAMNWAASLGSPEEQSIAYGCIAVVMADEDPEAAGRLLAAKVKPSKSTEGAVSKVAHTWSTKSQQDAADWVTRFDSGEMRNAGLKAVTSSWMIQDSEGALGWISSLESDNLRKEANRAYAEAVLQQPEPIQIEMLASASAEMKADFEVMKAKAEEERKKADEEQARHPQE